MLKQITNPLPSQNPIQKPSHLIVNYFATQIQPSLIVNSLLQQQQGLLIHGLLNPMSTNL